MNTHELPMILFTVIAQMCVGTFLGLGVIQLVARRRYSERVIDRLTDPVLFAIGPVLVVGLIISMFHMNDIFHTLNVIRHWQTSWLSREIIFGVSFAAFGFLFALMQWFKWGSSVLRQVVALVAAVLGVGLLWSMSQIYASLPTVPAWNTWIVPFQFFGTALILGPLAICAALLFTDAVRRRKANAPITAANKADKDSDSGSGSDKVTEGNGGIATLVKTQIKKINTIGTDEEWGLTTKSVQGLSLTAAIAGILVLVSYSLHLSNLNAGNETAQAAAEVFSGSFFMVRLLLLGIAAILLTILAYRVAATATPRQAGTLAALVTVALILAFIAEIMGRSMHYDSMLRIGI